MSVIYLEGNWKAGWAIDLHTLSSTPIGNGKFDTKRTKIGESLYKLKYCQDYSQIPILVNMTVAFLKTRLVTPYLHVILPVPPSHQRKIQPVIEVARQTGKALNIHVDCDYLFKKKQTTEIKGINDHALRERILKDAFGVKGVRYQRKKVLLFDDLYRSGATLKEITRVLYEQGKVQNVYVLTLTKTRTKQ